MGWTLTNCDFYRNGQAVMVHALGNNAAWVCPECGAPILFVYRAAGGTQANPARCQGCSATYYLDPQFVSPEPPPPTVQPAPIMTIV
jgi:predicted RNA-binding Zn-ribbon protein involved in translation (DUF1610 family)